MPIDYPNLELLHEDDFADLSRWHHEGVGSATALRNGGMRLHCFGSRQGAEGCMVFFRPELPDHIAVEYDIVVHHHGGIVINYLALRGLGGEDLINDRDKLPPRKGVMSDYWSERWGLQSYHLSYSRFDDEAVHTKTSNWRKNPGCFLVGHGIDPVQEIGRTYRIRLIKDAGHCQFFVNGEFAHAFVDHDATRPIPDHGKFGFRLVGSNVAAEISRFSVHRITANNRIWKASVAP